MIFKPGETKKILNIPVKGDTLDENNEKFQVQLSGAKNGKLSDQKAVGIIRDDDTVPENFKDAIDLEILQQEQKFVVDNIGFTIGPVNRDTEDYFRFEVEKEGSVSIFLDSFIQNLGIKLYADDESLMNESNEKGNTTTETIQTILDPGVYYLKVFPVGGGATNYRLIINVVEF